MGEERALPRAWKEEKGKEMWYDGREGTERREGGVGDCGRRKGREEGGGWQAVVVGGKRYAPKGYIATYITSFGCPPA